MIKTWQQRCEEHPDHNGIVTNQMIQARMQDEIDELRAALEQAQEPVACMCGICKLNQRQWQGLTDDEISKIIDVEIGFNSCWGPEENFARAIEAKLREKNT